MPKPHINQGCGTWQGIRFAPASSLHARQLSLHEASSSCRLWRTCGFGWGGRGGYIHIGILPWRTTALRQLAPWPEGSSRGMAVARVGLNPRQNPAISHDSCSLTVWGAYSVLPPYYGQPPALHQRQERPAWQVIHKIRIGTACSKSESQPESYVHRYLVVGAWGDHGAQLECETVSAPWAASARCCRITG